MFYKYYVEGSTTYRILDFLYDPQNSEEKWAFMHLSDVVVIFKSEEERVDFERYIASRYVELTQRVETCDRYNYINTGNELRTNLYKQRLQLGVVLNEMLNEYRNMDN